MSDESMETAAVTDEQLDAAAADAVNEEVEEEVLEEEPAQEELEAGSEEEVDEEGLPKDHGKRSDLGRKVAAQHRRMDEIENTLNRIASMMEQNQRQSEEEEIDPDVPLTLREWQRIQEREARQKEQQANDYENKYYTAFAQLVKDMEKDEYKAITDEMANLRYNPSSNPEFDAERNFLKAQLAVVQKRTGERKNPLKGAKPKGPIGTVTNQRSTQKEKSLPTLDPAAADFLKFVEFKDGKEKAQRLHQELAE